MWQSKSNWDFKWFKDWKLKCKIATNALRFGNMPNPQSQIFSLKFIYSDSPQIHASVS